MKKTILITLLILFIFSLPLFAGEEKEKIGLNLSAGVGVYVSHVGLTYDVGRWEFGGNIDTGFPNLFIISMVDDFEGNKDSSEPKSAWDIISQSFLTSFSAFGGDLTAKYDVIKNWRNDLDLGLGFAGIAVPMLKTYVGFIELCARYTFKFNQNWGMYIDANLPVFFFGKIGLFSGDDDDIPLVYGSPFASPDGLGVGFTIMGLTGTRLGFSWFF